MSNKIKDIFSDDLYNVNGSLHFRDDEAYKDFLSALEMVSTEGCVMPLDGVTSITTAFRHFGVHFPLEKCTNIKECVVGPPIESVAIELNIDEEKRSITLMRTRLKDKVILQSTSESIVSFRFEFLISENKVHLNYKVHFEKANSMEELADSFGLAFALLDYMYSPNNVLIIEKDNVSLSDIKEYFCCYKFFFKRLNAIQGKLNFSITPSLLNALTREEQQAIDELYLLLCDKKIVRLNAKLTATDSTSMNMNLASIPLQIGSKIKLTFISTVEFNFLKQDVTLYTANLLENAVVKDMKECEDGTVKILYGDTDSKPMYIAFSAFKTKQEAEAEMDSIMPHSELYVNALTTDIYIKQFYEKDNK